LTSVEQLLGVDYAHALPSARATEPASGDEVDSAWRAEIQRAILVGVTLLNGSDAASQSVTDFQTVACREFVAFISVVTSRPPTRPRCCGARDARQSK